MITNEKFAEVLKSLTKEDFDTAQRESLVSKELPMSRLELQITLTKLQDATAKLDQLTKQWDDAMAMYDKQ